MALLITAASCGFLGSSSVSETERQVGAEQHPILLAEFGGAYQGNQSRYVSQVGTRIANAAGLNGRCTFTLVNTDVVNAFAVPGCYIYVTRGLMSLVSSEDELASVLAHEVGHIAGEHAEQQQRRARFRNLGVAAVASISRSERLARLAGFAAEFFALRYSRRHEYEADELGLHYLKEAGYDPFAATDMLDALERYQAFLAGSATLDVAKSVPEWALTHPYTDKRIARAADAARETGLSPDAVAEREVEYLRQLDGMLYGDDPEQGFVLGRRFAHPALRIGFTAPPGFSLTNSRQAIYLDGPDGLRGEFSGGALPPGGLPSYAQAVLAGLLGDTPMLGGKAEDLMVNGLPAHVVQAAVATEQGEVIVSLAAYVTGPGTVYHFVMMSRPDRQPQLAIAELFRSFRRLAPSEAAMLRPRVVDVVRAAPGDTIQTLARRVESERPLELLLTLNGRSSDQPLRPGELLKIVVWR